MALWGGRFSETGRAELTAFSESISFDKRLYKHDILGSKAHVAMLAAQGIIPQSTADAIRSKLDEIKVMIDRGEMEFKAELEDIHMHIESTLIAALGDEGARLHSARSRNDQVALDIRLYLRDELDSLIAEIREFQKALVALAAEHPQVNITGIVSRKNIHKCFIFHTPANSNNDSRNKITLF